MHRSQSHLIADVLLPDVVDALSEGRWLLGAHWSPLVVSSAGDVFLINPIDVVSLPIESRFSNVAPWRISLLSRTQWVCCSRKSLRLSPSLSSKFGAVGSQDSTSVSPLTDVGQMLIVFEYEQPVVEPAAAAQAGQRWQRATRAAMVGMRAFTGMSQKELGRAISRTRKQVANLESSRKEMGDIPAISRVLDIRSENFILLD